MLASCDSRSTDDLGRLAHGMKGSAGLYGFKPVSDQAARVVQALREHQPFDHVVPEVHAHVALVRRIEGYNMTHESPFTV